MPIGGERPAVQNPFLRYAGETGWTVLSREEALDLRRRLLGDQHPDVASSLNNLASIVYAKGDYDAAEPLFREALAMRRRVLGEGHPNVAASINMLASVDNAGYFEADLSVFNPLRDELCSWQATVDGAGNVRPPEGPGLGVEIDEALIEKFPLIDGPGYV